jgi:hypothetical protein
MCGADFGAFIRKQYDDCGEAIRESDIKAEWDPATDLGQIRSHRWRSARIRTAF